MPAPSAALLKHQIEAQLAHRIPAALSPMARQEAERQPLHDPHLTELLSGGVPLGGITEMYGAACSGRTSVALSLAAAVTAADRVVAWIDVSDELDPETAALCGVDLERLLWVRCGRPAAQQEAEPAARHNHAKHLPSASGDEGSNPAPSSASKPDAASGSTRVPAPNLVAATHSPRPVGNGGCGSPHPLHEGRGMAAAIDALLQQQPRSAAIPDRRANKAIGTPGMPNRKVSLATGSVSHHVAMVLGKAAHFPNGMPAKPARSNLVPPEEIVPTSGSLFGREVERKHTFGSDRAAKPSCFRPGRPALPFPQASPYREEQIPTDRQPSRRAKAAAAQPAADTPRATPRGLDAPTVARNTRPANDTSAPLDGTPLDQALRSVDLLLQAGGFSLLVLDLSSIPADKAWRIPLATWFRFRAGCERSRGSLLVLSQQPCARASADLTVALRRAALHTEGESVLTGGSTAVAVEQQRRGTGAAATQQESFAPQSNIVPFRKPVRSDHHIHATEPVWKAGTHWSVRA